MASIDTVMEEGTTSKPLDCEESTALLATDTEADDIKASVEQLVADHPDNIPGSEDEADDPNSPPRRITRARTQAEKPSEATRSEAEDSPEPTTVHPLFLLPPSIRVDPDFGLPPSEAEETRVMLAVYVQKQEEVCRSAKVLYDGLLEGERLRDSVFGWTKAEAHVGELSDGEDWYDIEEWALEGPLKKGHTEEDDDTALPGKKTRGRRA